MLIFMVVWDLLSTMADLFWSTYFLNDYLKFVPFFVRY